MLTGSQGAGIGAGGTFFILFLGLGIWYPIHRAQKKRLLEKTQSAASKSPTTNATTPDTYADSPTLEMGTAEGNTHELPAPQKLHEMGDLAPEYTEGDGPPPDADEVSSETPHRDGYRNEKRSDEKSGGAANSVAELEGDVAFRDGQALREGEVGKEGVGKGFVLTD